MEILGIGPTELIFSILLALIILGPKDMQKAGRTIGRWLRNLVTSEGWRAFLNTSREIRNLPNRLMREANLEDLEKVNQEIGKIGTNVKETVDKNLRQPRFGTWGSAPPPPSKPEPAETLLSGPPAPAAPPPSTPEPAEAAPRPAPASALSPSSPTAPPSETEDHA